MQPNLSILPQVKPVLPAGKTKYPWADWAIPLALFIGLCGLYGSCVPLDYTVANQGADGGDLLAAVLTGGIPHPSGYPAYLLLAKLFQLLPIPGTPYFRGALLSIFFTALSASLVAAGMLRFGRAARTAQIGAAVTAGLVFGTAPLVWSQAVIVEVYGLQSFFTACCLLGLAWLSRAGTGGVLSRRTDLGLCALAVLAGLGLGNHLTLLFFTPALLAAVWVALRARFSRRFLLKYAGLALFAVILVYAILPLRARLDPPVNWGNPQTLDGLVWLVSGRMYQRLVFGLPPAVLAQRASAWAGLLLQQAAIPGLFLGILGAVYSFKSRGVYAWILLLSFVLYSLFSIGYQTNDSQAYLLPAVMIFAIWAGMGAGWLAEGALGNPIPGKILLAAFLVFLLARLPATRQAVDPRADSAARDFARKALSSFPPDALVLTSGDTDTFVLWYYHYGLGQRPDLTLIAQGLTGFDWYYQALVRREAGRLHLPSQGADDWATQLGPLNPERSVCVIQTAPQSGALAAGQAPSGTGPDSSPEIGWECRLPGQ